jgi:hypothetical protein
MISINHNFQSKPSAVMVQTFLKSKVKGKSPFGISGGGVNFPC